MYHSIMQKVSVYLPSHQMAKVLSSLSAKKLKRSVSSSISLDVNLTHFMLRLLYAT